MKNSKNKIRLGVLILSLLVFITSMSYTLWQITLQQTDKNVITTGCFKIEFSDVSPINLAGAYPISDEEGVSLVPYEFTITNTCDSKASFQINLEVLNTTTLTDLSVIKMVLSERDKEATSNFLTSHEVVSKTLENATSSYKLKNGFLKANESKTFNLRLWLDENTPTEEAYMNKTFESKVTVISSLIVDETPPEVIASTSKNELNSITVDASDSFDEISGIETYSFRIDEEEWNTQEEPVYTFSDLEYKEYNIEIQASDFLGNKSEVKALKEYPKVRATEYVNSLNGNGEVLNDETADNNVRYIGANPKNYIDIGDRDADGNIIPWRIIGAMNNIKSSEEDEVGETRLKIIRAESIGEFSWDSSINSINDGKGINEWSQADLNVLLNNYYYNSTSNQKCYNGENNVTVDCNFENIGLSEKARNNLEDAVWFTGTNGLEANPENILASKFYELERSENVSKICTTNYQCNDNVTRTVKWTGIVSLVYPSDYGYATGGGITISRETCLDTELFSWNDSSVGDCKDNNWLYNPEIYQWTVSPSAFSNNSIRVVSIYPNGIVRFSTAYAANNVFPVLFLKSNVNITSGAGQENDPYVTSLD